MTEITQADCDVAETLFNDVLGNVSNYGEWGYMSYRQAAERSMAEAFARHRLAERAKIVAWLRGQGEFGSDPAKAWGETFAELIEEGEHETFTHPDNV